MHLPTASPGLGKTICVACALCRAPVTLPFPATQKTRGARPVQKAWHMPCEMPSKRTAKALRFLIRIARACNKSGRILKHRFDCRHAENSPMCLQSSDAAQTRVATTNVPHSRCPQAFLPASQILPYCASELDTYSLRRASCECKRRWLATPYPQAAEVELYTASAPVTGPPMLYP